jgi:hypothetical protein
MPISGSVVRCLDNASPGVCIWPFARPTSTASAIRISARTPKLRITTGKPTLSDAYAVALEEAWRRRLADGRQTIAPSLGAPYRACRVTEPSGGKRKPDELPWKADRADRR